MFLTSFPSDSGHGGRTPDLDGDEMDGYDDGQGCFASIDWVSDILQSYILLIIFKVDTLQTMCVYSVCKDA